MPEEPVPDGVHIMPDGTAVAWINFDPGDIEAAAESMIGNYSEALAEAKKALLADDREKFIHILHSLSVSISLTVQANLMVLEEERREEVRRRMQSN